MEAQSSHVVAMDLFSLATLQRYLFILTDGSSIVSCSCHGLVFAYYTSKVVTQTDGNQKEAQSSHVVAINLFLLATLPR